MDQDQKWISDRRSAIEWARNLLESGCCILDTETTGLRSRDQVVQIGLVTSGGVTLMDTLVRPTYYPDNYAEAEAIHGITRASLASAPSFAEVWPELKHHIVDAGGVVVIYNAQYDLRMLTQTARGAGVIIPNLSAHCAMLRYSAFIGERNQKTNNYRWQKLPGGDHSAVGDALATLDIIKEMATSEFGDAEPENTIKQDQLW